MASFVRAMLIIAGAGFLVMVTLQSPSSKFHPDGNVDRQLEQAAEHGLSGDFAPAIASATDVIDRQPSNALAYLLRGTAHRRTGEYSRAVADCSRAIELDPQLADAYTQRAFAYQQSGKDNVSDLIFADVNRAITMDPTNALSFLVRGKEQAAAGDQKAAIADFGESLRLNPTSYSALANRAMAKATLGSLTDARQDLRRALELNPPDDDRAQIVGLLEAIEE